MIGLASVLGDEAAARALEEWAEGKSATLSQPARPMVERGNGGGQVVLVVVDDPDGSEQRIVKVCPDDGSDEYMRYSQACRDAQAFAEKHLVKLREPRYPIRGDNHENKRFLLFVEVDNDFQPVLDFPRAEQYRVWEKLAVDILPAWNPRIRQTVASVVGFLDEETSRYAITESGGYASLVGSGHLDPDAEYLPGPVAGGVRLPNPFRLLRPHSPLAGRMFNRIGGRSHGDAHLVNAIARIRNGRIEVKLFDLADYESDAPVTRDLVRGLLSLLALEVSTLPSDQSEALIMHLIAPDKVSRDSLLPLIARPLDRMHHKWTECGKDRRSQYLLSLLAEALNRISFRSDQEIVWWHLRLAAIVAKDLLDNADACFSPAPVPLPEPVAPIQVVTEPRSDYAGAAGASTSDPGRRPLRYRPRMSAFIAVLGGLSLVLGFRLWHIDSGAKASTPTSSAPGDLSGESVEGARHHPLVHPVLTAIADRLTSETGPPPPGGAYTYVKERTWSIDPTVSGTSRAQTYERERWWQQDRSGCESISTYGSDFRPRRQEPRPYGPGEFEVVIPELASTKAELRKQLREHQRGMEGASAILRAVADVYRYHSPTRAQAAAMLAIIAEEPDTSFRNEILDPEGRIGVGVSADYAPTTGPIQRDLLIVDKVTGQLLSHREVWIGPGDPVIMSETVYLKNGRMDESGCR